MLLPITAQLYEIINKSVYDPIINELTIINLSKWIRKLLKKIVYDKL